MGHWRTDPRGVLGSALHYCDIPPTDPATVNGQIWECHCGKMWRPVGRQSIALTGPTGIGALLNLPVWEEIKPVPVPFSSVEAADAFLEGRGATSQ